MCQVGSKLYWNIHSIVLKTDVSNSIFIYIYCNPSSQECFNVPTAGSQMCILSSILHISEFKFWIASLVLLTYRPPRLIVTCWSKHSEIHRKLGTYTEAFLTSPKLCLIGLGFVIWYWVTPVDPKITRHLHGPHSNCSYKII